MILFYLGLYAVGIVLGLVANLMLDVQLRLLGIRQAVGLVIFAFLLWGAVSVTHTPFTDILLPLLWAGTGALAGLGSRSLGTASA